MHSQTQQTNGLPCRALCKSFKSEFLLFLHFLFKSFFLSQVLSQLITDGRNYFLMKKNALFEALLMPSSEFFSFIFQNVPFFK